MSPQIPKEVIYVLANMILPEIQKSYESKKCEKDLEEWKIEQEKNTVQYEITES